MFSDYMVYKTGTLKTETMQLNENIDRHSIELLVQDLYISEREGCWEADQMFQLNPYIGGVGACGDHISFLYLTAIINMDSCRTSTPGFMSVCPVPSPPL